MVDWYFNFTVQNDRCECMWVRMCVVAGSAAQTRMSSGAQAKLLFGLSVGNFRVNSRLCLRLRLLGIIALPADQLVPHENRYTLLLGVWILFIHEVSKNKQTNFPAFCTPPEFSAFLNKLWFSNLTSRRSSLAEYVQVSQEPQITSEPEIFIFKCTSAPQPQNRFWFAVPLHFF